MNKSDIIQWSSACTLFKNNDREGAIKAFLPLANFAKAAFNIGHLLALGDYDDQLDAVDYYTLAIDSDPYLAVAYLQRGCSYIALKQYPRALEDFRLVIKLLRQNDFIDYTQLGMNYRIFKVYYNKAICYEQVGDRESFLDFLVNAENLALNDDQKSIIRATKSRAKGMKEGQVSSFEEMNVFSVPGDKCFQITENKLKNIGERKYLGVAEIKMSVTDDYIGFSGAIVNRTLTNVEDEEVNPTDALEEDTVLSRLHSLRSKSRQRVNSPGPVPNRRLNEILPKTPSSTDTPSITKAFDRIKKIAPRTTSIYIGLSKVGGRSYDDQIRPVYDEDIPLRPLSPPLSPYLEARSSPDGSNYRLDSPRSNSSNGRGGSPAPSEIFRMATNNSRGRYNEDRRTDNLSTIRWKIQWDGDLFTIQTPIVTSTKSYTTIIQFIQDKINIDLKSNASFKLKYIDRDGDLINVLDGDDLKEAERHGGHRLYMELIG